MPNSDSMDMRPPCGSRAASRLNCHRPAGTGSVEPQPAPHHHATSPWRPSKPLKIALEITPNLEPLFGTRDENLRLMEDKLGVRIDLRSDAVHVQGPEESVVRVQRIFQDFEAMRRQGINPHNGELNGMLRLVVADPATTLRSLADAGKQRSGA